ncbi:unnamed protein product [Scytosiphon promiscuus]
MIVPIRHPASATRRFHQSTLALRHYCREPSYRPSQRTRGQSSFRPRTIDRTREPGMPHQFAMLHSPWQETDFASASVYTISSLERDRLMFSPPPSPPDLTRMDVRNGARNEPSSLCWKTAARAEQWP